jgi:hypothetical protein
MVKDSAVHGEIAVFKFLKEWVDSAKEGLAEARPELAQEAAEKAAKSEAASAEILARLERASALEKFAVSLAAPYRQAFMRELGAARREERPAIFLTCIDLPDGELASWKKLLERDFSVDGAANAQDTVAAMVASLLDETDPDAAAVLIARATHLATGAAALGYASHAQVLQWLEPVAASAAARFDGWKPYGEAFLTGERDAPGSNALARKLLRGVVDSLVADPVSPWVSIPWPSAETAAPWRKTQAAADMPAPLEERMASQAADFVAAFSAAGSPIDGSKLDYSSASMVWVDQLLDDFFQRKAPLPDDLHFMTSAYVFESARRAFGGRYLRGDHENPFVLVIGAAKAEVGVCAMAKVRGRATLGPEDSLHFFCQGIAPAVQRGVSAMLI